MSEDLIRYDILTQEALRTMIANLLDEITRTGLPGDHHFFITFDTCAPNVKLSPRMKEKYPEEMTIVIQHRYWDLEVKEAHFQIGLSFDEIAELLVIPFAAIKGFYDPSVKFGLQFEVQTVEEEENTADDSGISLINQRTDEETPGDTKKKKRKTGTKQNAKQQLFEYVENLPTQENSDETELTEVRDPAEDATQDEENGAQVVSLDSFRKKK